MSQEAALNVAAVIRELLEQELYQSLLLRQSEVTGMRLCVCVCTFTSEYSARKLLRPYYD